MKDLKISFVKFYQAVTIGSLSAQTSCKVVTERTVQNSLIISIEKSNDGVLITTENVSGTKCYTEIPYNNLAYIVYEAAEKAAPETKATKTNK